MIINAAIKKFTYLYQRIGSFLPWKVAEKIKVLSCVLMSQIALSSGIYAFGKSFKSFFIGNGAYDAIKALKEGLDSKSLTLLDILLFRLLNFPEFSAPMHFVYVPLQIFTKEELEDQKAWFKFQRRCFQHWKFAGYYDKPPFFYHNGLKNMPQPVLDYIRGKDFLDLGAYIGDSALVFHEYAPHKIISFDMSLRNREKFWKTMRQNKIPKESVEFIVAGLSDSCGKIKINDTGLDDISLNSAGETEIDLITIDEFTRQRQDSLNIGLIKMDVEGFGLAVVKGMVETIKKYRPILLLSIYHNPDEFFKIKPFIASLNFNYRFAIRKFSAVNLTSDTYLLAWPAELGVASLF